MKSCTYYVVEPNDRKVILQTNNARTACEARDVFRTICPDIHICTSECATIWEDMRLRFWRGQFADL